MKQKILNAFVQYDDGTRPDNYGKSNYWFVLNPENIPYPVKVIWALANKITDTTSFHSKDARTKLVGLGFSLHNSQRNSLKSDFYQKVQNSIKDSVATRQKRLSKAIQKPASYKVMIVQYDRNPDVVAETLYIANGKCQSCNKSAPFKRRKDCSPYLEVHHKVRLADGGDDTVQNAIALCPNCHRKTHYG